MKLNFKARDFVHLHLHTDYSLLQSTIQLKPLAKRLNEMDMQACAITDFGNMYGAISFYNTMKASGIHPILGYEAYLAAGSRFEREARVRAGERPFYNLVLLAKDLEGYQNLVYLASKACTEGMFHKPRIDIEILSERSRGLIAISSGFTGSVWHFLQQENRARAVDEAKLLEDIFGKGNFYVEIQNRGLAEEIKLQKAISEFAGKNELPLVACNEAFYLTEEDARAQEILMCIGEQKTVNDGTRSVLGSSEFYVRAAKEMWNIFGTEQRSALENTLKIAEMCQVDFSASPKLTLPQYPIPAGVECRTTDEYFEKVVLEGFEDRRAKVWLPLEAAGEQKYPVEDYRERIKKEISTIKEMEFPGYFLIVWDFIRYAREKGIPVGPGRGSAAGSLVAYCLEITDVDPLRYDLLFERFLNPERVSMPDIDIDFCVRGRGEVINHVSDLYGRESVCQIITFGTMASKAALKDVGRALNMPYAEVEKIAKLIPPPVRGRNISISQALEQVSELKKLVETETAVGDLVDLAKRLEGCARHSSVHAAGVVISPRPLHELIPITISSKSELTSQYSMNDLEKVGMLKMDFLALTTLTVISDCLKSLKQKTGIEINWSAIPLNDEATMRLFGEGRTEAVFQFESAGMQEICRRLKPKELEDLAALNALYRPGPLDGGMVDDFIARHRGEKRVQYIVPEMKEILNNTYGILVYQEQIMQLAQKLGGYSLGEADLMRRAMGKKKREEMAVHEEKFISGAVGNNIKREKAEAIFKLMAQFADYGFNRSHSVAYAYIAYQTAYLKAHYPAYFYASVLSNEAQDTAKIYKYSNELRSAGLKFLPPDINESDADFTPLDNAVRFGLSAIKGIGAGSVQAIIESRKTGKFSSLFDFTARISQGSINRRGLESLIAAGAFDSLKPSEFDVNAWRAGLYAGVENALSYGQRLLQDRQRGQNALFGGQDDSSDFPSAELPAAAAWTATELAAQEKAAIGFYLSTHPLDNYKKILSDLKIRNIADYEIIKPGDKIKLAGIASGVQVKHSKKGNRFCIFRLEDQSTGVKCLAWSEAFVKFSDCLKDNELLIVEGKVESVEGQEITVILETAKKLSEAISLKAKNVFITLPDKNFDEKYCEDLFTVLGRSRGSCEVFLSFKLDFNTALKVCSRAIRIQGSSALEIELQKMGCQVVWNL
ncbi:MAG: DNA polymerase III subunit alpha [Pyrinomonadaceae bacterium]